MRTLDQAEVATVSGGMDLHLNLNNIFSGLVTIGFLGCGAIVGASAGLSLPPLSPGNPVVNIASSVIGVGVAAVIWTHIRTE